MKILIIVPDLPPDEVGGTELFTKDLADNLAKVGHQVVILTTGKKRIEKTNNLTIIRTKKMFKNRILYNIQELLYFIKETLKLNPDIIVGHMITSSGAAAIISAKIKRKTVVLRLSGCEMRFSKYIKQFILKPLLKLSDGIITINAKMKQEVELLTKHKNVVYLPQGFTNIKEEIKKKNTDGKRILSVGRLVSFKNYPLLLKIARIMPEYNFTIIGEGEEREKLEINTPSNVEFKGKQTPQEVIKDMYNSDVFVNTSVLEPFGRTLLEAMSCGLPLIAMNKGGPKSIIINDRNGYLIEKPNAQEFADKIKKAIKNNEEIYINNLKDIEKYYWNNLIGDYVSFYKKSKKKKS